MGLAFERLLRGALSSPITFFALPLLGVFWGLLWTLDTFWNPLFFGGMWVGATLSMYVIGRTGYPGWRHHLTLAAVSVPVWWWFELVNSRLNNWEYVEVWGYTDVQYSLLATLAFSTVVPALDSAWSVTVPKQRGPLPKPDWSRSAYVTEALFGAALQVMVFVLPNLLFPLVWVAPFLIFDGMVGYGRGRSLAHELYRGKWHLAAAIGLAGLTCGFLWEFWNFWSTPKWIYHVAYLGYLHVFEMPILGYLGYVPFAWSVYQLLHVRPLSRYAAPDTYVPSRRHR